MQKWEYLTIEVEPSYADSERGDLRVVVENGRHLFSESFLGGMVTEECPPYTGYIQQRGSEGWEIVGLMPNHASLHVLFKRPKS